MTVTWNKVSNAAGYQICYSLKSNMKSGKLRQAGGSSSSISLSKLKKGKKYYVWIRAYVNADGQLYYGDWSSRKAVKIKK